MSGPTGYEVGGARTLQKTIGYTEVAEPGEYPTADNVFADTRNTAVIPAPAPPVLASIATTFDTQGYQILYPVWGAPAVFRLVPA